MLLQDILERALRVAQQAEVYYVASVETPVHFEANHLKRMETVESRGVALRIIKDGRMGFVSSTNLLDIPGLIRRAAEVAALGVETRMQFPGNADYPEVPVYDPSVERLESDDLAQLGQQTIDGLRTQHPDALWDASANRTVTTTSILNSNGCNFSSTQTLQELSLEGTLIQGTDMLFVYDTIHSGKAFRDTRSLQESLSRQMEMGRKTVQPVSGDLPVIFTPRGVSGALLWPLTSALNGRTVVQGTSPLTGRLGEQVVDQGFTLWDDPTTPFMPGSGMSDDEGAPSQRLPLIQKGVAANFLYDVQTAAQAGKRSTSSATRWSLEIAPLPSASVTLVEPGNTTFDAMVKDIKRGIIVESMLGAGQSNVLAGDFSGNVLLGYRVEDGKIIGRVKDTVVSGNVYKVLNNLAAIGNEPRWVWGRLSTPPLYCKSVSVAANQA